MEKILVVDDCPNTLNSLNRLFKSSKIPAITFEEPGLALDYLKTSLVDIIVSDQHMPQMTGVEFLDKANQIQPNSFKVLLSGHQDVDDIIFAFNEGIIDQFLTKPWDSEYLLKIITENIEQSESSGEQNIITVEYFVQNKTEENKITKSLTQWHDIIYSNNKMRQSIDKLIKVSKSNSPISIIGETGAGKELFARAAHAEKYNDLDIFVAVNCANFTEELLESQLFGHVKGAFTGANSTTNGLIKSAENGTLFLDEVVEMPLVLQAKLLRTVQAREYFKVGSTEVDLVKCNFISASQNSLAHAVEKKEFRNDLRFRLEVLPIVVPPLRNRKNDIIPLLVSFLQKHKSKKTIYFMQETIDLLERYIWPGNIRELDNAAAYINVMSGKYHISPGDLPETIQNCKTPTENCRELTIETIFDALENSKGNKTKAAATLGISRMTLWRRMKEFRLENE